MAKICVLFRTCATEEEIAKVIEGLEQTGQGLTRIVTVPDGQEKDWIEKLKSRAIVKTAELEILHGIV